jgi:hypothetical protein
MQPLHLLGEDAPPATALTGDVPSRHLTRPVHPLAGGVKVIQQAARLLGLLANSTTVPSSTLYSSSLLQEASPVRQGYADLGRQGARRLPRQQTLVGSKHYILYVHGPTCRGPVPLCMPPPSTIKGEACDVTHTHAILGHTLDSQAHKQYISQWSRVLRSGSPNHSKSLCVLEFFPFIPTIKQNA